MRSEQHVHSLPLAVLAEELQALDASFAQAAAATDLGERSARVHDLIRDLDRYIRLESEVLLPVLVKSGVDASAVQRSHAELRASIASTVRAGADDWLPRLRSTFLAHAQAQRERIYPAADKLPQAEQEALAYELDEVRKRMRGAYGV